MSPKPGTQVSLVAPTAPKEALEAANATTGAVTEMERQAAQGQQAKLGSVTVEPYKPPETQEEKETKLSWIEIELVDEADKPVPGARYRVTLPDGKMDEGTLDANGFARIDGFEPGDCKVAFPGLDQDLWEKIG